MSSALPDMLLQGPRLALGIAGCDRARRVYGAALDRLDGIQVAALTDDEPVTARLWAREIGRPAVYSDFDRLLLDEEVEAVVLASPIWSRVERATAAAASGKHVLCETPIAGDLSGVDSMLRGFGAGGSLLLPAYRRRFHPVFRHVEQILGEGRIGDPIQARCDWTFYASPAVRKNASETWWHVFEEHAGHTIDLCRLWMGEIETVSADVDVIRGPRQVEDLANVILNHLRGISVHHISRISHKRPVERYQIDGTEGTVEVSRISGGPLGDGEYRITLDRHGRSVQDISGEITGAVSSAQAILTQFAECIRTGRQPEVMGMHARKVIEAVTAAYLSTMERAKISLPLVNAPALEPILHQIAHEPIRQIGPG